MILKKRRILSHNDLINFVLRIILLGGLIAHTVATPIGNVQSLQWNDSNKRFDVDCGTAKVRIIYYREDIFRIWVAPTGSFANGADECIVYDTPLSTAPTLTDATTYYKIETDECVLRVYKTPCKFALYRNGNTTVVFEEESPIDITASRGTQTIKAQSGDYFYGCGGWNGHFCLNGQVAPARYTPYKYNENDNPNAVPYYCNLKGYGALRNTWKPGTYTFRNPVQSMHEEGRFDCYYFYGPSMKKVLEGYTLVTGRPFMPPIWGLDFGIEGDFTGGSHGTMQQCTDEWAQHDFAAGWNLPNDYFSSPYEPVEALVPIYKALNIWTNLWCGRWMADTTLRKEMVKDWGIRYFKMDCEWIGPGYEKCFEAMETIGPEGIEKYSPDSARTFLQFTAGWIGQQRFGYPWTGDNSMRDGNWTKWHIPTLTGSAMSGLNGMSVELASIFGSKIDKLYVRALQWQAMLPYWHLNGFWSGYAKYPWVQAPQYEDLCRKIWKLRTRLTPYIYTLCYEAWETGVSTQRPCLLEFPDDPNTWDEGTSSDTKTKQQFMLGPWFLLRPVHEDLTTTDRVRMYLPGTSDTRWIDYHSGAVETGGKNIQAYAGGFSISGQNIVMPTYLLEGAIIPMWPEHYYDGKKLMRPRSPLTLDVYPHKTQVSSFSYYEDDGLTREFKRGRYATTLIESDARGFAANTEFILKIGAVVGDYTGKPQNKTYLVSIHTGVISNSKPPNVYVDGQSVEEKRSFAILNSSTEGWFYDASDRKGILWVKATALPTTVSHLISTSATGIHSNITNQNLFNHFKIISNSQGTVNITFDNMFTGKLKTSVCDIRGRVLCRKTLNVTNGNTILWSNSSVGSGNYIVTLEANGKKVTRKFLVTK